jgi:nucleosome assembly protein 1-like 1
MMDMLPPSVVKRVEKLKELNDKRETFMEEYLSARALLEQKYQGLCLPLYKERREILTGGRDKEIAAADGGDGSGGEEVVTGIPQFWVCAMGHMETVAELITESDVDCLENLIDVTCDDFVDGRGFTLSFHFRPNEYFENEILTKRYEIPNLLLEDEPILKNVIGCEIKWKPGRSLTSREVQKKQRSKSGKRAGQIRTVTKIERTDSFFHFFNPPKMPSLEEMDEEQADAIEEAFDHDYDVAQSFRSHLIPKAVLWFTGQVRTALDEEVDNLIEEIEEGNGTD